MVGYIFTGGNDGLLYGPVHAHRAFTFFFKHLSLGQLQPQSYQTLPYRKSKHGGVEALGAFTQIGAFGVTGEWVFGQRTHCGMMAAPYGIGFLAMDED
jgi:hypothetical protein